MPSEDCEVWTKAIRLDGYGAAWDRRKGRMTTAHRFVYERKRGAIPEGYELHHLCGNKSCVNPEHLELVTRREHSTRDGKAALTRCKHGHDLTDPENVYRHGGQRHCRACRREADRRRRAA